MKNSQLGATPKTSVQIFGPADLRAVELHVIAARAVLRTVRIAVQAQLDGSVTYENNEVQRWQPAVDLAVTKLALARDVLIDKAGSPAVDWYTPLSLLEAAGAALWHTTACAKSERLDFVELETVVQVAIELLDSMREDMEKKEVSHV